MSKKEISFIEMLFSTIAEDSAIPDEIKPYIMSLRIPVLKASADKRIYTDTKHPARITLHLLTKISRIENNIRDLSLKISKITDNLIHAGDVSTNNFITSNRELLLLIKESDKCELIREYEIQQNDKRLKDKSLNFRQIVITELQEIISDNSIPILAHELILKIWPQFMFKNCFEHGENSSNWNEGISKFKLMINYLQPVRDIKGWLDCNENHEIFIKSVHDLLTQSDISQERILINTNALSKAICANLKKYRTENEYLFTADNENNNNKLSLLPAYVKVGEWYDLFTAENCAANRLKLSLIIEDQAKLIFVDHRGIKGMVKDVDVFAEELSHFLSRPVESKKPKLVDTWNEFMDKLPRFK